MAKPSASQFLSDVPAPMASTKPSASAFLSDAPQVPEPSMMDNIKSMPDILYQEGRGAINGATFGKYAQQTPQEQATDDSMMNPDGTAKTTMQRLAGSPYKVGQVVGDAIPLIAADFAAGIAVPTLVAKYGLNAFKAAVTGGALTGMTYAGLKGAVLGKPPVETAVDMAKQGLGFGALGAAGYGAGKVFDYATKDIPEKISTEYLNTPSAMAQQQRRTQLRTGEPSLGQQFLDKTDYGVGQSKNEVYNDMSRQLENNRMVIKDKLQQADASANSLESGAIGVPAKYETGPMGESVKTANETVRPKNVIDLNQVRANLEPIVSEQMDIGKPETANAIKELQNTFAQGEGIVSNARAYDLLTKLDSEVSNAYLKTPQNIPPGTEARAALANYLRQQLKTNVPEVSGLLSRNHFLMNSQTALLPQVSSSGGRGLPLENSWSWAARKAAGNRVGLGAARVLQSPVTTGIANVVSPVARQVSRYSIADQIAQRQKQ